MSRSALFSIALAMLLISGAVEAQTPAKTHRKTPARTYVHTAHHQTTTHRARRTAQKAHLKTEAHTGSRTAEKRTPEEAGRTAGLAIRRNLEHRRMERRSAAYRGQKARPQLRYASVRATRKRATAPVARTMDVALDSPARNAAAPEASRAKDVSPRTPNSQSEASPGAVERADVNEDTELTGSSAQTSQSAQPDAGGPSAGKRQADSGGASPLKEDPASALNAAKEAADAANDAPAAEAGGVAEQASLYVPRRMMPAPLRGSLASLERQNEKLEAEGLERIEDESDLEARITDGMLVPVPVSGALSINDDLPADRRYCRPWTAKFLRDLARNHDAAFHRPLEVSSAVRTVAYQRRLKWINGNAAPAVGDIVSPHLTGATVDIAKRGMTSGEIAWMRRQLLALEDAGKIDVEEEFRQSCFHITVYTTYAPSRKLHAPSRATAPANGPAPEPDPSSATDTDASTGAL